jgi:ABC-2 type transport system permease protein
LVEKLGIDFHYESISRGVLDSRDVIYFLSVSIIFLLATLFVLERKKS